MTIVGFTQIILKCNMNSVFNWLSMLHECGHCRSWINTVCEPSQWSIFSSLMTKVTISCKTTITFCNITPGHPPDRGMNFEVISFQSL